MQLCENMPSQGLKNLTFVRAELVVRLLVEVARGGESCTLAARGAPHHVLGSGLLTAEATAEDVPLGLSTLTLTSTCHALQAERDEGTLPALDLTLTRIPDEILGGLGIPVAVRAHDARVRDVGARTR